MKSQVRKGPEVDKVSLPGVESHELLSVNFNPQTLISYEKFFKKEIQ